MGLLDDSHILTPGCLFPTLFSIFYMPLRTMSFKLGGVGIIMLWCKKIFQIWSLLHTPTNFFQNHAPFEKIIILGK